MTEIRLKTCRRGHEYVPKTKDCPECQKIRARKWYNENIEICKLRDKARYIERKGTDYYRVIPGYTYSVKRKEYHKAYSKMHKDRLNREAARRKKESREECPIFRLRDNLRSLISQAFRYKGIKRTKRTLDILGCSFEFFQEYLKRTAIDRYGKWGENTKYHIDHIIPLVTAKTEEELIMLNHYTNLQLLYPEDNLKKGAKLYPEYINIE